MWLPRTAVSVDAFHLVKLGNDMLTEVRQRLTQQVHGRRGRSIDPVWANRRLLLRAGDTLSDRARDRLNMVFATDDASGSCRPRGWSKSSSGRCWAPGPSPTQRMQKTACKHW
nr:transposase [Paenarthrobacter ureafaciens]